LPDQVKAEMGRQRVRTSPMKLHLSPVLSDALTAIRLGRRGTERVWGPRPARLAPGAPPIKPLRFGAGGRLVRAV